MAGDTVFPLTASHSEEALLLVLHSALTFLSAREMTA